MKLVLSRVVMWISWALSVALMLVGVVLWSTSVSSSLVGMAMSVSAGTYATVALVLALRHPENPFHWVLRVIGLGLAGVSAAIAYSVWPAARSDLVLIALWVSGWLFLPAFVSAFVLVPLLFPTGRPPSPRWSPLLRLVVLLIVVGSVAEMFEPGSMRLDAPIQNPLGASGLAGAAAKTTVVVMPVLVLTAVLMSFAAFIVRFRRSDGLERAQLKWLLYVMVIVVVAVGLAIVARLAGSETRMFVDTYLFAVLVAFPIAIAIAILRYRLYDIDVLINRTLVYGVTSAALLGLYALIVFVALTLLRPITQGSELPVAIATLGVASVIQPVRDRVQRAVDRRFYRSRYDAARTVDALAVRMRDQVDLDALRRELVAAARETMQPAHVRVWLRGTR